MRLCPVEGSQRVLNCGQVGKSADSILVTSEKKTTITRDMTCSKFHHVTLEPVGDVFIIFDECLAIFSPFSSSHPPF